MAQLKVVLDTSILISALKTKDPSRSPAIRILELLKESTLQNYGSKETLQEMKETLAVIGLLIGKPEKARAIYNLVQNHTKKVSPRVKFEDDPRIVNAVGHLDDVKFLNVVYASKARYLISMNTAHLVKLRNEKTLRFQLKRHWFYILTAGEFLKHIREKYGAEK
ncbi:putative toxin-antitoxin system toxin component, PIN family [Thermococcus sp. 9N3]|uniref:putative toxin-antitoxin system toxin component, PIN family n=1 Tax=Thermococcus sp. 9N3 TaxID=163002 RepID=UPI001431F53E|nr:putative toxin-antitoxin system toxin component, PIN family [Thermococcus sp. 9N3]NJE49094.1 putative toxin-antitoxin system toxin component, PIN family [Thermococcus sp. 9N3]